MAGSPEHRVYHEKQRFPFREIGDLPGKCSRDMKITSRLRPADRKKLWTLLRSSANSLRSELNQKSNPQLIYGHESQIGSGGFPTYRCASRRSESKYRAANRCGFFSLKSAESPSTVCRTPFVKSSSRLVTAPFIRNNGRSRRISATV